jgi:hypothetical protein
MEDPQEKISDLQSQFDALKQIVYLHKHLGFDYTKPLDSLGAKAYSGSVAANAATSGMFPASWSCSVGTGGNVGKYTITHNLATTAYTVVAVPTGIYGTATVYSQSSNSFIVETYQQSGTQSQVPTDGPFNFIMSMS